VRTPTGRGSKAPFRLGGSKAGGHQPGRRVCERRGLAFVCSGSQGPLRAPFGWMMGAVGSVWPYWLPGWGWWAGSFSCQRSPPSPERLPVGARAGVCPPRSVWPRRLPSPCLAAVHSCAFQQPQEQAAEQQQLTEGPRDPPSCCSLRPQAAVSNKARCCCLCSPSLPTGPLHPLLPPPTPAATLQGPEPPHPPPASRPPCVLSSQRGVVLNNTSCFWLVFCGRRGRKLAHARRPL